MTEAATLERPRIQAAPAGPLWYVLAVETGQESTVRKQALDAHVDAYVPLRTWRDWRRGKLTEGVTPLMPGYVFARLPSIKLPWARRNARGEDRAEHVYGLVRGAGCWAVVSEAQIEALRQLEREDGAINVADAVVFLAGCHVSPTEGPFEGLPAVVTRDIGSSDKITTVDIAIFGRPTPTEIEPWKLRAIG